MPLVLLISYSSEVGGAERILLDVAPALGDEVCLAAPEGPLAEEWRKLGLRLFPLRKRHFFVRGDARQRLRAATDLLAHAREQRELIEGVEPGLVVAWGMRPALACALARRAGVPVVFQHNDMLPGPLITRAVRTAAKRADLVLCLSEAIAGDLDPRAALRNRLRVIHPGVDLERFSPRQEPADPPEMLVLGAIVPWKRPDFALEVLEQLRRRHPQLDLRLRIVGSPIEAPGVKLEARLLERIRRDGLDRKVELASATADSRAELERASCLLHCAPREPFGMVVLEAMACERPVVVPEAGGPAEIVDSSCALLYPPDAPDAAADAVAELIGDPARAARMGASGRRLAGERFDVERTRRNYAEAISGLIGPGRNGATAADQEVARRAEEVAIVTVTHNSAEVLPRFLQSIHRHLPGVRVVVVDCGSRDQSLALAQAAPGVSTVEVGSNIGFGAGTNLGVREVSEPVTILLNPDVELIDDSLLRLAGSAAQQDGLLAPLVLNSDGTRQDTVHPAPCSAADLLRSLAPPALTPHAVAPAIVPWRATRPTRVGWAVGCALAAKTKTLRRLGPFDERIFLYGEDLDLGLRARDLGIETWFWPHACVIHHRAHATAVTFGGEPFEMLARARHQVVRARLGHSRARVDDAAQAVTFASRIALKRLLGRSALRERRQLRALRAVVRQER